MTSKWLTFDELAGYLKFSRTKLYRMAQEGGIPAFKVRAQWRFDREEIYAWVKSHGPGGAAPQRNER
ncbi:MAG: helix-turn-helix domain-containing protein [Deltaproteobacteria bacterium]|nr:helix-turn-helix domain-containing protein [Deltaproteobacteria bacterium]